MACESAMDPTELTQLICITTSNLVGRVAAYPRHIGAVILINRAGRRGGRLWTSITSV